jgi:outer membrane immunogenic protein
MRKIIGAIAALALGAPITSALAADLRLPVKAPPMPVVAPYSWTGFYIGGNVGYSFGRDPIDVTSTARTRVFRGFALANPTLLSDVTVGPVPLASGTADIEGGVAGGQIGYNWQAGAWVFGLETDLQWTGQKGSVQFCAPAACPLGALTAVVEHKLDWFCTFRGRAGWLVDPRVLLYATGGLAYGQVTNNFSAGFVGLPLASVSAKNTRVGWTIGGGVEGALSNNWTIKAEYLYMDLGTAPGATGSSTTILADTPSAALTTVIDASITAGGKVRDHIFRVGVNYRFGPEPIVARY